jgi:exonuclease, DNA polymerase III, epsilon subunit family
MTDLWNGRAGGTRALVIDCETTGLGADHRVVTFAALALVDGEPTGGHLHLVFNPGRRNDPVAASIHGWHDAILARQDPFDRHADRVHEALGSADVVVAHNLGFDAGFLRREFGRLGRQLAFRAAYCTMQHYRRAYPGERRATLDACLARLGHRRRGQLHGALEDALLAACVFRHLALGLDVRPDFDAAADPSNFVR